MKLPLGLDVRSWVARRGGSHRGHIELRGAQACAGHGTTHREPAARTHPHPPPHVQPVAPVWQRHGRCRLRTPKDVPLVVPARAPPRSAGHPGVAPRGGNAIRASRGPRDARPTRVVILAPPDEGLAPRDAPRQRWRAPGVVSHTKEAYSQATPLASHKSPAPLWHVRGVPLRATAEAGDCAMARCATRSGGCALP